MKNINHICAQCIKEPVLKKIVVESANDDFSCDFCETGNPAVEMSLVAKQCNEAIETFFEVSSQTPAVLYFNRIPAGEDIHTLLTRLVGTSDKAIESLLATLEEMWYDHDTEEPRYGEDPHFVLASRSPIATALHSSWNEMEASLRGEARYLNPKVTAFMEKIFGAISSETTADGRSVLTNTRTSPLYNTFYRARVFETTYELEQALQHPERYLGAPPVGIAKAGRMNAPGQSAFYGATREEIALAEVRPPVGSLVAVARFGPARPLTLLNLALLEQIQIPASASLFDPKTKEAFQRHTFLRELSRRLVQPVMPERQDRNYLITQVIADYLAMHPTTPIDGIIYPSVQHGTQISEASGENVVLFHKAAATIYADVSKTADAILHDYDDDEYDLSSLDEAPLRPTISFTEPKAESDVLPNLNRRNKRPGLVLVRDSIIIHQINAVSIISKPIPVEVVYRE